QRLASAAGAGDLLERYTPAVLRLDSRAAGRAYLFEEGSAFMVQVSERVPYVMYVNDLQWARGGTADLLCAMVQASERAGSKSRLCVLGSYRVDELEGSAFDKVLGGMLERAEATVVTLDPLDAAQTKALLASMLGIDDLPDAFAERVASETQ